MTVIKVLRYSVINTSLLFVSKMQILIWLLLKFSLLYSVFAEKSTKEGGALDAAILNNKMSGVVLQNLDHNINMVFSGYSLGNAMGMLLLGAKVPSQ